MAELTYDDFKRKLSIQDVLIDAGYINSLPHISHFIFTFFVCALS